MNIKSAGLLPLFIGASVSAADTNDVAGEVAELRQLVAEIRQDYETRITDLEVRLERAEQMASGAKRDATEAFEIAEQTAIEQSSGTTAANTYNPSLGAVVSGRYASIDQGWDEIPGFQPAGEIGTGESGFALGEAEINLNANVDNRYFGNLTFALHDEGGEVGLELEEAWLQTTGLSSGVTVIGGRFFSAAGYLNSFHPHADDFVDRPLPYQAFYGGQYKVDGIQLRWVAPTSLLFELGTELNWGGGFPATANAETSPGAYTLFAKLGGDAGVSNSWQLGFSWLAVDAIERGGGHHQDDVAAPETFTGDSDLAAVDFVWKWAPDGNSGQQNFKLQGEYFSRSESGLYADSLYDGDQTGWYLQGVWQFRTSWRLGLRHDVVDADNKLLLAGTELEDPGRSSSRDSVMLDWSPSEFSRLRLQYTHDRVLSEADQQLFLQYIMSVGAHGAHQF
jgi:hypothetical protein